VGYVIQRSDVLEALRRLGGKATSREILEFLLEKGSALEVRNALAEAVRSGEVKKEPDYERRVEVFVIRD
jgi:hypothetical protein